MTRSIYAGQTSTILRVMLRDPSNNFQGKTGLVAGDCGVSLTIDSLEPSILTGEAIASIGTFEQPSANTKYRFGEVDSVRTPGLYEFHFHDNTFTALSLSAAREMDLVIRGTAFVSHWERFEVVPHYPGEIEAADIVVDKSNPAQWQVVWYRSGTLVELMRKDIKDVNGAALTSTGTVVGQLVE